MTNGNNDVRELEDLLTELEGQGALPVGSYAEEDDVVTQLMDAPLGEQEWMVQITPLDRRMMSTDQLLAELGTGHLVTRDTLVWRAGMNDWAPASRMEELRAAIGRASAPVTDATLASVPDRRPAPLPPPAPVPPPRVASSALSSPSPLGRVPLPPPPSAPFGAPKPPSPVPDVSAANNGLPLMGSAFNSPPSNGAFSSPSNGAFSSPSNGAFSPPPSAPAPGALMPDLDSAFNLPPAAAVPVPPPVVARVNTQRPVAVDFSEMEPSRSAPLRVLIGSGIAAAVMIAGTVYALSAGGVFESEPAPVAAVAESSKPAAPSAPAPAAAAPKPAEPAAAPAEAQTQPASVKEAEPPPAVVAEEKPAEEKAAPEEKMAQKDEPAKAEKAEPEKPASEKVAAKGEDSDEAPEKVKSSKSDDDASERASRRTKASRTKKASAAEEKKAEPAPRRSKPRAAPVASAAAAAPEANDTKDVAGSTFNRDAAKTALDDAAAQARNCRPAGGQSGAGKVQVRYEPNGKVGAVSILTPQFDGTTTGDCVVMVFRRANIPAFTGSPAVVMNKNFEIP